jgi:hypothetical protein
MQCQTQPQQQFLEKYQLQHRQAIPTAVPHNAVPNAKPMAVPGKVPTATPHAVPNATPTAVPHNAVPNAKPMAVPGKVPMVTPQAKPSPGIIDRIRNFFRGDQEKIIEPGIRNKEVEAYRTKDAKEVEYRDTIIQDDKNVSLPKKHTR